MFQYTIKLYTPKNPNVKRITFCGSVDECTPFDVGFVHCVLINQTLHFKIYFINKFRPSDFLLASHLFSKSVDLPLVHYKNLGFTIKSSINYIGWKTII